MTVRTRPTAELENSRMNHPDLGSPKWAMHGAFQLGKLRIMSSGTLSHDGWEHVSVSRCDRIPTWMEMCHVKDLFWMPEELVVQFHPPRSKYVNIHPNVLHLWKPPYKIELPPKEYV